MAGKLTEGGPGGGPALRAQFSIASVGGSGDANPFSESPRLTIVHSIQILLELSCSDCSPLPCSSKCGALAATPRRST